MLAADPQPAVRLVVDYGDGVQVHFTALPWQEGMTVVDALAAAQKHPRGIKFTQRGRAASAMITELGGLKNQGDGKNWLFSVGGKTAEVGAGALRAQGRRHHLVGVQRLRLQLAESLSSAALCGAGRELWLRSGSCEIGCR